MKNPMLYSKFLEQYLQVFVHFFEDNKGGGDQNNGYCEHYK